MIYCVEDERNIRELIVYTLESSGFTAKGLESGKELNAAIAEQLPDLILLDIMLPGEDGLEILSRLKASEVTKEIPVIMVTAKGAEYDKVMGLDCGADDYITKPFNPVELIARVKAQLRRYMTLGGGEKADENSKYILRGLELDDVAKQVFVDGEEKDLTPTEFEILKLFLKQPGKVISPKEIYRQVWKDTPMGSEGTVAVHIRHLREKIEINPSEPRYLKVVWGQGYKCEK